MWVCLALPRDALLCVCVFVVLTGIVCVCCMCAARALAKFFATGYLWGEQGVARVLTFNNRQRLSSYFSVAVGTAHEKMHQLDERYGIRDMTTAVMERAAKVRSPSGSRCMHACRKLMPVFGVGGAVARQLDKRARCTPASPRWQAGCVELRRRQWPPTTPQRRRWLRRKCVRTVWTAARPGVVMKPRRVAAMMPIVAPRLQQQVQLHPAKEATAVATAMAVSPQATRFSVFNLEAAHSEARR